MNSENKTSKDFRDRILREQVLLVFKNLPTMQITSFIVALVLSYLVRDIVHHVDIFMWILMIMAIALSRIAFYSRFLKVREELFDGEPWKRAYLTLSFISGITWGLSSFMIFPAGNPSITAIFVLVIASLSAATTVSHSSIKFGPLVWVGPAMLLYAIRCSMEGGEFGYGISFLIIIYLITIILFSFNHNNTITSAISLNMKILNFLRKYRK